MTITGHWLCAANWVPTEPSSRPSKPPSPREPTTTMVASWDSSTRAPAADPGTMDAVTVRCGNAMWAFSSYSASTARPAARA
jgi:hypothetical protein